MSNLKFDLITAPEALLALRPEWDALHAASGGSVFQSYEWLSTWWNVFGDRFALRTGAVRDGDRLVALLPCFRQSLQQSLFRLKRIRFLGEHQVYGEYKPLVLPDYLHTAARAAALFLKNELNETDCDLADFNSLPAEEGFFLRLQEQLAAEGLASAYDENSLDRMTMTLPADASLYPGILSKRARAHMRHDETKLFQNGVSHEIVRDPARMPAAMDVLEQLHALGWSRKGKGEGYFADRCHFRHFLRQALVELMRKNSAQIHLMTVGQTPLSATLILMANGHCTEYVGGFDPNHALSKFSPGKILTGLCIREAIRAGCTDYDLQGGCEPYKAEVGCKRTSFSRLTVYKRGLAGIKPTLFLSAVSLRKKRSQRKTAPSEPSCSIFQKWRRHLPETSRASVAANIHAAVEHTESAGL